ncbi:hypothetical protein WDW86_18920, partial [Bdellovibrionota bacterium FG-2]
MRSAILFGLLSGVLATAGAGCARGYLNRSSGPNELPAEVPREAREKFAIKDSKDSKVPAPVPPLPLSVASP